MERRKSLQKIVVALVKELKIMDTACGNAFDFPTSHDYMRYITKERDNISKCLEILTCPNSFYQPLNSVADEKRRLKAVKINSEE